MSLFSVEGVINMFTLSKLEKILKEKYNLMLGERAKEELREKIQSILKTEIKISGRSYTTERRKILRTHFKDLVL